MNCDRVVFQQEFFKRRLIAIVNNPQVSYKELPQHIRTKGKYLRFDVIFQFNSSLLDHQKFENSTKCINFLISIPELTFFWLRHSQLLATFKGTASIIQC